MCKENDTCRDEDIKCEATTLHLMYQATSVQLMDICRTAYVF